MQSRKSAKKNVLKVETEEGRLRVGGHGVNTRRPRKETQYLNRKDKREDLGRRDKPVESSNNVGSRGIAFKKLGGKKWGKNKGGTGRHQKARDESTKMGVTGWGDKGSKKRGCPAGEKTAFLKKRTYNCCSRPEKTKKKKSRKNWVGKKKKS